MTLPGPPDLKGSSNQDLMTALDLLLEKLPEAITAFRSGLENAEAILREVYERLEDGEDEVRS